MAEKKIKELCVQYKDHPLILSKIDDYIENQLPKQIQTCIKRERRHEWLTTQMKNYINAFFSDRKTQFYYIGISNIFIHYTENHYKIIPEDDIWHAILSDISSKKVLMDWKYKVKTKIVKLIREKEIFYAIPESSTIQYILNFLQSTFFKTREQAKYFLTCMGDSILKKNTGLIHFIHPHYKSFIDNIQESCLFCFHNTITPIDSFKYRYHEHDYKRCRLLYFDMLPPSHEYWHHFLKYHILDLIAVACHYSIRFLNSDNYIIQYCHDARIQDHSLYLKNKNAEQIVADFITSYLIVDTESNLNITWNNMYFLWKEYLATHFFPNIVFKEKLKENLMLKLSFNKDTSSFLHVSSIHLKYVQFFGNFWDTTINDISNNNFEIGELCSIYKDWLKLNHPREKCLQENKMLSLIQYFYPRYEICEQKYILNISSTLWDKKQDIRQTLEMMKKSVVDPLNFYQIYEIYCAYAKKKPFTYVVSKKYFENAIRELVGPEYVLGDTISEMYWQS